MELQVQHIPILRQQVKEAQSAYREVEEELQVQLTEITVLRGETARLRTQLDHTASLTVDSQVGNYFVLLKLLCFTIERLCLSMLKLTPNVCGKATTCRDLMIC